MALRETDPARIGGYPVEDRLGSGGMGVVYLARSASGRRLAVKVVHGQYADDPEFRARFRREVAAARQVSGAFTAPVVDADADAASPWMATLYIPGENLGTHVRREGPLPPDRLLELAAGLTEALRDIHRVGVVHRDLKPANVMLAEDGPRVIDFGVSRAAEALAGDPLTQTGRVMGTPPYMSPEQLTSPRDVGPASDIFSLGSVLTYAATGRGPFDSASPYETATGVVESIPELDRVPAELRPFVTQCLTKHPKERPTPDELLALLRGEPVPRRPPQTPEAALAPRPRKRRRLLLAASVGGLALAVLGAWTGVRLLDGDTPSSDLPAGWRSWQARAELAPESMASASFTRCVAARGGLVCAGDDVQAARFSLTTGKVGWKQPVNGTEPEGMWSGLGNIIGTSADRRQVYVYRSHETKKSADTVVARYEIQARDVRTGKLRWKHATTHGESALAPDPAPDIGGAVATKHGILTLTGAENSAYALLVPGRDKPVWQRELPADQGCNVRAAGGRGYLVCVPPGPDGAAVTTRVSPVDPRDGRPLWTAEARGELYFVGRAGDGLVFVREPQGKKRQHHSVVVVEPSSRRAHTVRLSHPQGADTRLHLAGGTLYFVSDNGSVGAFDPGTGRRLWSRTSSVDFPGPPLAAGSRLYIASPTGRLAALDRSSGEEIWARSGRRLPPGEFDHDPKGGGAPLTLVGDALYVPYGVRSVYSVDVRNP
ncbi:serine/threonine-protein kinase [Streptomyces alboflavus]|uniref:serine/threonine-protein kinase n=1 Tax=Streptomyces alboflavus TaxID=67267 RepID=UPI0036BFE034